MKPLMTKIEINMNIDYSNCYIAPLNSDSKPLILDYGESIPFEIVSVPSKPLTDEERLEKFALAIHDWINKHD